MAKTNQPETLLTRLRAAEQRIAELERGRTLTGATVSRGVWEVRDDTGSVLFRAGQFDVGGVVVHGVGAYRANGSLQMLSWDDAAGDGYFAVYDEQGSIVLSTDTVSGQGLARPYVPLPSTPWSQVLTPPELTTSATFAVLHRIDSMKQHPWIKVRIVAKLDAGTVGEVRLALAGAAISAVTALADGTYAYFDLTAPVTGGHLDGIQVDVEARRVSGAGNVRILLVHALGRQT